MLKIKSQKPKNLTIISVAIFIIIGVSLLIISKASSTAISFEPENGTPIGNITNINDLSVSNSRYIKFNASTSSGFSTALGRIVPDTLYGVTIESVSNLNNINTSLTRHTKRPITRIVFQDGDPASYYVPAVDTIRNTSYILGEILDSAGMNEISTIDYKARATSYVNTFGKKVDIWEIGNELNGEWLGTPTDIRAKVQAAYDVVKNDNANLNLKAAITLNYWPSADCYSYSWEDTATFAQSLSTEIKNGTDYILLSFYETACSPRAAPSNSQFISIFNQLKTIFPNAKVGMGEIGAQGIDDGLPNNPTLAEKQQISDRYYGMHDALKTALGSRYVGGYFWWYYFQDAVPYDKTNSMWANIEQNFNSY